MDVVEPCRGVNPRLEDGIIRSDGTTVLGADAKAGLAAILEAVERVRESGRPHPPLELVVTVGEEMGLAGASHFDVTALTAQFGLVVDSQLPVGGVIAGAPTEYQFEAVVHGRPAHAGVEPEKGVSAALIAAEAISALPWGRLDPDTTANVGRIHGGVGTNVVMPELTVAGEARSFDASRVEQHVGRIAQVFLGTARARGGSVVWTASKSYEGYEFDEGHPLVQRVRRQVEAMGLPFLFRRSGGGSDANVFNARGLPTLVLGYGPRNIHTLEEAIAVDDVKKISDLLVRLIMNAGE